MVRSEPGRSALTAQLVTPRPTADPLKFTKGYRPSLQEFHQRLAAMYPGGPKPGELERWAATYNKQYGRYPNKGKGLSYTSGPGVAIRSALVKNPT